MPPGKGYSGKKGSRFDHAPKPASMKKMHESMHGSEKKAPKKKGK